MVESGRTELEKLVAAASGLETQRTLLGDAIIQPALDSLNEKIAALKRQAAAQPSLPEERRIVTILFADLVGSTLLARKKDPEEWREIIQAVHSMGGRQVQQFNGSVLQLLGDGLLAIFGSLNASEKDPENAVRAALAMQAEMPSLVDKHQLNMAGGLQMRIGVHTGLVVIGELRTVTRHELTATGDAMNIAARVEAAAPPGGILITHDTFRFLRQSFEVQPQPRLEAKGITEPLRTYLVIRVLPAEFTSVTRGVTGIKTPTIGRASELVQLHKAYDEVVDQKAIQWLQLIGEAGVGKSRLVGEMRTYLDQRTPAYHLFKCRAFPGDEHQAYAVPRRMWMDFFHITEDTSAKEIETRWFDAIRVLTPLSLDETRFTEAAFALGFLLGIPLSQPQEYTIQADQLQSMAMLLSRQLLSTLCRSAPLVLLLEDVQWLDQVSWEYVCELFLNQGEHNGILILATSRQDWQPAPGLKDRPIYRELFIPPLAPGACSHLVHALFKNIAGVPEHVVQRIIQRAEGIPYFIEEMVNWLIDLEVINQESQPWQFVGEKYDPSLLPDTLQHLLQTRLDNLDSQAKTTLQYGSVLGRRFWEGWLEARLGFPCRETLLSLQTRGFITLRVRATFEGETEWRFLHQVQQEVAYSSLLKRQRKELHQLAADWLEERAVKSGRLDEFAATIGNHAYRAGDAQKACDMYFRAGRHAKQRGALSSARVHFERALELLPEQDYQKRWPILLEHDEVLGFLSDRQARLAEDALLVSIAQQMGRQDYLAEAYDRQANYLITNGNNKDAAALLKKVIQSAISLQDLNLACKASSMLTICLARLGEMEEANHWAGEVQQYARQSDDDLTLAMALNNLSTYYAFLGDHYQSVRLINQQVLLTRKMKHRMGEARGLGNLGYEYILLGLYDIGIVTLQQALEMFNVYGMLQDASYAQLNLGLAYMRVSDFSAARHELDAGIARLAGVNDQFGLASGKLYLGLAYEQHGDLLAAQDCFKQAEAIFKTISVPGSAMDCQAGLVRCALKLGDLVTAKKLALELWTHIQQGNAGGMEFPIMAYQACAMTFERSTMPEEGQEAVQLGHALLMDNTGRISQADWRQVYLHQIPENEWIFKQMTAKEI